MNTKTLKITFATGAANVENDNVDTLEITGVVAPVTDKWVEQFITYVCLLRGHILFNVLNWELVEE